MLSLPQWLDDLILPKSEGESTVDAIYGPGGTAQTGMPDPTYDVTDFSQPHVFVQAKGAVQSALQSATSSLTSGATKLALYVGAFLLLAVFIYAIAPALVRR